MKIMENTARKRISYLLVFFPSHDALICDDEKQKPQYQGGTLTADKKEVVINLTGEQRSQTKSATGQDFTKLKVGVSENANPPAANYSDDRSLLGAVLDDRSIW